MECKNTFCVKSKSQMTKCYLNQLRQKTNCNQDQLTTGLQVWYTELEMSNLHLRHNISSSSLYFHSADWNNYKLASARLFNKLVKWTIQWLTYKESVVSLPNGLVFLNDLFEWMIQWLTKMDSSHHRMTHWLHLESQYVKQIWATRSISKFIVFIK